MQDMSAFQEVKIAIYCNYKLHSVPERSECSRNSFLMAIVTLPRHVVLTYLLILGLQRYTGFSIYHYIKFDNYNTVYIY